MSPDQLIGGLHVAPRLRHLGAAENDHPLVAQIGEGLAEAEQAAVPERLDEEAAVEKVENGVLDPAHVLVEEIFRMARAWVDQRAGDPADGVVPALDDLISAAPGACRGTCVRGRRATAARSAPA